MAYKAKRRKTPEKGRPSTFFIVALVVGLILLVWAFITLAGKPSPPTTFSDFHHRPPGALDPYAPGEGSC